MKGLVEATEKSPGRKPWGLALFGSWRISGLPVPKWQQRCARDRITTQRLIQLLRQEVWGNAIDQIAPNRGCDDFVTPEVPDTKSPDMILAPAPPLAYARTG